MKINFNATYKNISRLIEQPAKSIGQQARSSQFGRLLGEISPNSQQIAENTKEARAALSPSMNGLGVNTDSVSALDIEPPSINLPKLDRMTELFVPTTEDNTVAEGVKTPTILSVKRILGDKPFVELKRDQRTEAVSMMLGTEARSEGVDPALGMSIVEVESGFNSNAVSRDGHESKGLFQLLDSTGQQYFRKLGLTKSYDPFNPEQNVKIGVNYLRYLHDVFSRDTNLSGQLKTSAAANSSALEKLAVAAFNAGEGRVASAQSRAQRAGLDPAEYTNVEKYLPDTTQEYVSRVLSLRGQYEPLFSPQN